MRTGGHEGKRISLALLILGAIVSLLATASLDRAYGEPSPDMMSLAAVSPTNSAATDALPLGVRRHALLVVAGGAR